LLKLFLKELLVLCQKLQLAYLGVLILKHSGGSSDVSSVVVIIVVSVVSVSAPRLTLTLVPSLLTQVTPVKLVASEVSVVVVVVVVVVPLTLSLVVIVSPFEVVISSTIAGNSTCAVTTIV